ncbi:MAG: pyruvate carboxylase subunit B, partial [Thermodesulfobacteriota bacterium]
TKILNFIAHTTVNSAIERTKKWELNPPNIFKLPASGKDANSEIPEHRKIFTEKGPEALSKWILKQKKLLVTDTTFRDAHQSLLATRMRTYDMLGAAEFTSKVEKDVFSFEMWGGATFDVCMRFLHESPWERLSKLRDKIPHGMFQMLLRGSNAVGYKNYPDNVVKEFIKKAASSGIDIFRIFDCFNWLENMKLAINSALETGKVVEAAICYTGDITDEKRNKYSLSYYVNLAKELSKLGVHIIAIKDMAGLCKPFAAEKLIKAIKDETGIPLHFHTHATSGNGEATILKASEAGVDIVDLSISSLSGGTSQPSLNAVVAALDGQKRDTGLDLIQLNFLSSYWESVRELYFPFEADMKSSNADVYLYEIPGGQYTNLRAQASSLGLGDRWEEIKRMYRDVNQLFGDIIKVTPSSKVVGDMSLFLVQNNLTTNHVLNSGENISFPESVIDMFKGNLGQPYKGFPRKIQKIVLNDFKPSKGRPGKLLKNINLKTELAELRNKLDESIDEKDSISYLLYP